MASYFDHTDKTHLALLPESLRDAEDIDVVAPEAEADVIDHYTAFGPDLDYTVRDINSGLVSSGRDSVEVGSGAGLRVYLRGYAADADAVDETTYPNFKADMRRAIVAVIRWRLTQAKREVDVVAESDDTGRSKTYSPDRSRAFPLGWNRSLEKYDSREPLWGI